MTDNYIPTLNTARQLDSRTALMSVLIFIAPNRNNTVSILNPFALSNLHARGHFHGNANSATVAVLLYLKSCWCMMVAMGRESVKITL